MSKKKWCVVYPETRLIIVQMKTFKYQTTHWRYKSGTQEASTTYPHTVNLYIFRGSTYANTRNKSLKSTKVNEAITNWEQTARSPL